jgi:hypothetical protein
VAYEINLRLIILIQLKKLRHIRDGKAFQSEWMKAKEGMIKYIHTSQPIGTYHNIFLKQTELYSSCN